MSPAELSAFLAVAEQGSFSAAAETLHLTQSAISRRIASLESHLQTRLFDRIGRAVSLTEGGHALMPRARGLLNQFEDTRRAMRNLQGNIAGPLALATSHHIGLHRLPPVLREFSRAHPEVHLDIQFLDSEQAHEMLLHGALELAIVTLAPDGAPPLESMRIWDDPLRFAVGRDHPLADVESASLEQLASLPAVLPGDGTYTGRIVNDLFESAGLPLATSLTTNYLETIRMLAEIGLGWTVLPETMLTDSLRPIAVKGLDPPRRALGWVRHPARTPSNAARAFLDVLERYGDPVG